METSYQFIIGGIIPATQEAFKKKKVNGVDMYVRKTEKKSLVDFKKIVSELIANDVPPTSFPTRNSVYVAIIQFFTSTQNDYNTRDVDNMAKTVLDVLQQNNLYIDDSQVRTLLVSKRVDLERVPQDLGFVYIKILEDGEDIETINGALEQAMQLYDDLKTGQVEA